MAPNTGKIVVSCPVCSSFFKVAALLSGKQVTCAKCKRPFTARETRPRKKAAPADDFFLCKLALNYGLIDEARLVEVLKVFSLQNPMKENPGLDRLLVARGGIPEDQLLLLKGIRENWDLRQAEKKWAAAAVEKKFIHETQARMALAEQARVFGKSRKIRLVCDILLESGALTREQCQTLLAAQGFERPSPIRTKQLRTSVRQRAAATLSYRAQDEIAAGVSSRREPLATRAGSARK